MPSGGVGIIAKRYLDFWWDPLESNIVDGRVSVAFVRLPQVGALALYSVYLETGVGLSGNLATLHALVHHAKGHHLPWVAGGDWNLAPDILAGFSGFDVPGVRLHAPEEATCHGGQDTHYVRDFYVTGGWVGLACEDPAVHPEHLVPTHDLVEMRLKGVGDWPTVRVAKQPPPLPATRPVGPRAEPPDWGDASLAVRAALAEADGLTLTIDARQELVDDAHAVWLRTARLDFGGIVDANDAALARCGGPLQFEDQPLCKVLATPRNPRSRASSGMRWLAGQLGYIAGMLETVIRGARAQRDPVRAALRSLRGALEPGGKFHYHYHRQPAWPEWEGLLRHVCDAISNELDGWRGSAPGLLDNVANFARAGTAVARLRHDVDDPRPYVQEADFNDGRGPAEPPGRAPDAPPAAALEGPLAAAFVGDVPSGFLPSFQKLGRKWRDTFAPATAAAAPAGGAPEAASAALAEAPAPPAVDAGAPAACDDEGVPTACVDAEVPAGDLHGGSYFDGDRDPFDDLDGELDDPHPYFQEADGNGGPPAADGPPDAPELPQATGVTYFAVVKLLAATAERMC